MSRMFTTLILITCALLLSPGRAEAQALDLRNNLKKLSRYLDDGFCDDALTLATQLKRREDGARSFQVWFGIVQAHYCRYDVAAALDAVDALQQTLTLTPDEARVLGVFTADVESSFGQLRLHMPGDRKGHPRLAVSVVDDLERPELMPFAERVIARLSEGVDVPDETLYLPRGTYEVEWSQLRINDFAGVTHIVGRSRPSPWRLSQLGDGFALGLGFMGLGGFEGEALTIDQLSGDEQIIVTAERLSFTRTPFFEASSTFSFPLGTLGRAQLRVDGRWRPQSAILGGVSTAGDDTELIPRYLSAGVAGQIQRVEKGWTLQGGVGACFNYLSYYEFIAFVEDATVDSSDAYRIAVNLPVIGGGPELIGAVGRSFRVGDLGVQVGVEGHFGVSVLVPTNDTGEVEVSTDSFDGSVSYTLLGEVAVGTTTGFTIYVRVPLF